jgi:hypothetical protein
MKLSNALLVSSIGIRAGTFAGGIAARAQEGEKKSVADGVYTDTQATRGAAVPCGVRQVRRSQEVVEPIDITRAEA